MGTPTPGDSARLTVDAEAGWVRLRGADGHGVVLAVRARAADAERWARRAPAHARRLAGWCRPRDPRREGPETAGLFPGPRLVQEEPARAGGVYGVVFELACEYDVSSARLALTLREYDGGSVSVALPDSTAAVAHVDALAGAVAAAARRARGR